MTRGNVKTYWRAPGEAGPGAGSSAAATEAAPGWSVGRREFLQMAGFAVGAAALTGCSRGVEHQAIPYLVRPEEVTPGRAYWYASVCGACPAGCGILTKNRDGRPIKLEGNPDHPMSRGGLCAAGQASVLALYDSQRLRAPLQGGQPSTWDEVDAAIGRRLEQVAATGRVRFWTDSTAGPAELDAIASFLSRHRDGRLVVHDPISLSAMAEAHHRTHGARAVPRFHFERAQVIASFGADFLGDWLSPVEHAAGYRAGRDLEAGLFSHHIQVESRMSLTGSNADRRIVAPAGSLPLILAHLAAELGRRAGVSAPWGGLPACPVDPGTVSDLARRLFEAPRGQTLVVCGDNDVAAQGLANYANHLLGNYGAGATVDLDEASSQRLGDDAALRALLDELQAGEVDALFVRGVNPVHGLPGPDELAAALERVPLVVALADRQDETARHAHFVCPEPHFLESWGDSEPVAGIAALRQPAIRPMGSVRPLLESLARWSGGGGNALDLLRDSWRRRVWPRRIEDLPFDSFWNRALHDGHVALRRPPSAAGAFRPTAISAPPPWSPPAGEDLRLEVHASAGFGDGRHSHNAWLHELPDPIAKTVWDNFAAVSPARAAALGVASGDVVRITSADGAGPAVEVPVLVQPGQEEHGVAIALGYGREGTDRFARVGPRWWGGRPTVEEGMLVGVNAAPLLAWEAGRLVYSGRRVRLEPTGRRHDLATTQLHHSLEVPERLAAGNPHRGQIVQETTLAAWRSDPGAGGHGAHHELPTLYPEHPKSPHAWGMAIDLTACTGCSACVIACQAENNTPVVGKDEVGRAREMHWMRIDRYYSGEGSDVDVVHMPMLCQHCDNAPCENVCPVQATAQSAEGLNQQVYNRCVGTRYCANNCPYKVRRFNWFNYPREDRLQNLSLNPDVTVRSRGVMEKCSLCVQRIMDGKAEAKRAGRGVRDGDIQPACAQSCPAGAISFGDMNDPESRIRKRKEDARHYDVLAELGTRPVVGYLTLVRNREDAGGEGGHHG